MSQPEWIAEHCPQHRILTALLDKPAPPHALLFTGPEGMGKLRAAIAFAKACCCQGRLPSDRPAEIHRLSCGQCKACKKIESGSHPDVIRIQPEAATIKIDQIRELGRTLTLKPYESPWRVVIIANAAAMNPYAANALLKMLEEPPERTVLILIADHRLDLLPTVVSRCQHVPFRPTPLAHLAADLERDLAVPAQQASIAAFMADGCPESAAAMAGSRWFARRTWLLETVRDLPQTPLHRILALAELLARDKEGIEEALRIVLSWFRDLAVFPHDPEKIVHRDLTDMIRYASQGTNTAEVLSRMAAVEKARRRLQTPANTRLLLEALLLELAREPRTDGVVDPVKPRPEKTGTWEKS